jgi:glucose/arabinose dehydrogenase
MSRILSIIARVCSLASLRTKAGLPLRCLSAAALLLLLSTSTLQAATLPAGFTETLIAGGLSSPTAMAFAPDGRIFVCQQGGQLRVIKNNVLLATPFVSLTVNSSGERGLLGIAFDPNFATNQYIYLYYTATTPAIHNRVSRFTANGDVALAGSEVVLLDLNNLSSATNHNGGAMHFGADGKLYIAVGENANAANAQTLGNLLGKMLRINPTPGDIIPTDNPFFNTTTGNNRAIWALGLRNPFTFNFQRSTGRMFINDVGQNTWEEINDGIAGSNYGWSNCEGFCSPPNPNFRDPIFQYANDGSTCAITGGTFYNPPRVQFPSSYLGKYFYSDFCGGWIRLLDPTNNTSTGFATGISSPVDLQVSADGSLYYLARGTGQVFRVQFPSAPFDFDGDGRTDIAVFRPNEGNWYVLRSGNNSNQVQQWGTATDRIVPADYDGDRKTDFAVFREAEGNWYIIQSSTGTGLLQGWGQTGDIPVPGDYDADGRADIAIYRASEGNWYIRNSGGSPVTLQQWGASGDKPVAGDYDGDGKTDIAVFRPSEGTWYIRNSSGGVTIQGWGEASDIPVPGDYDGDGKTDVAVFRTSDRNWYLRQSTGGVVIRNWGQAGDLPVPGDYDGDKKTDVAVWRAGEGNWYVVRSGSNATILNGGLSGDRPVPAAYVPE